MPHQYQAPLLHDRELEGHLQIPCLVGTASGVLVERLGPVGDACLPLWRGKLLGHPARLRGCRFLKDTLYGHGEQRVLDSW